MRLSDFVEVSKAPGVDGDWVGSLATSARLVRWVRGQIGEL